MSQMLGKAERSQGSEQQLSLQTDGEPVHSDYAVITKTMEYCLTREYFRIRA